MAAQAYYQPERGQLDGQQPWGQQPSYPQQAYNNNNGYAQQQQQQYPEQQYQQQQYPQPGFQNGKPSQPYAAPSGGPPPQSYGGGQEAYNPNAADPAPFSQETKETGERFRPKKRLNDPIFLFLYLASVVGFAVLSGIAISTFISVGGLGGGLGDGQQGGTGSSVTLDYHTVYLLLLVAAAGLLLASLYLMLVRAFTKIIMEVTLVLNVLLNIALCIYYFIIKYWSGAIIFLIIAVISVLSYWFMRRRIPLAKLLLQVTMDVAKHHPSVYVVVMIGLVVQTALSAWYAFTCIAIYVKWTPGSVACNDTSCSSGKVTGLVFYATFAYLWSSQVVANVCLATLAGGVYGGWYYYGPRGYNTGMPKRATLKAFVRASTLSLGSIAFGSLIVTLLELLRIILNLVQQNARADGDAITAILACVAACCVGCVENMIQWFNKYAYIEIALYGKSYIPAAKDTWRLLKDRGIDALVNDSLVHITLTAGAYIVGLLCSAFGYLYLRYTKPSYNDDGQYSAPIILFSFLIGLNVGLTLSSALDGGVSTIFVGLGEDPGVLAERSPALFEEIRQNYPRVVQGVPQRQ